jgi:sterol desaturase/sphingolipid hydroxylase (fatty acid hydroxylase superfamily)
MSLIVSGPRAAQGRTGTRQDVRSANSYRRSLARLTARCFDHVRAVDEQNPRQRSEVNQMADGHTRLDSLTWPAFLRVYFAYPAVQLYLVLACLSGSALVVFYELNRDALFGALAFCAVYPLIEYGLHRFVLHSSFLYRSAVTAALWKRIHFDHHADPDDGSVILGAIVTMLPAVVFVALPLGYLVGGATGVMAGLTTGLFVIAFYELVHCSAHLSFTPRNAYARKLKRIHLLHHFHNETKNFGITSPICDILFGTYYDSAADVPRSPTTRNLGYTGDRVAKYPWVARWSKKD